jgi:hypothetical protein
MTSNFPTRTRRLRSSSVPARAGVRPHPGPGTFPAHSPSHADVWLQPGNLVAICDELGAQMFSVVDGAVTFTARGTGPERRWHGRLGAQGLKAI